MLALFRVLKTAGLEPDFHNDDLQGRFEGGYDWMCPVRASPSLGVRCLSEMKPEQRKALMCDVETLAQEMLGSYYVPHSARFVDDRYWGPRVVLTLTMEYEKVINGQ